MAWRSIAFDIVVNIFITNYQLEFDNPKSLLLPNVTVYLGANPPEEIHSPGPRLVILFKAGSKPGVGFKANYRFETGSFMIHTGEKYT